MFRISAAVSVKSSQDGYLGRIIPIVLLESSTVTNDLGLCRVLIVSTHIIPVGFEGEGTREASYVKPIATSLARESWKREDIKVSLRCAMLEHHLRTTVIGLHTQPHSGDCGTNT